MNLLSIDSSTHFLSVALLSNNQVLQETEIIHTPPQPNPLLACIDQTLETFNFRISDMDGFVVTLGPGSFTGLRVAISLIKGFVLATEKPVVGVSSLKAWALRAGASQNQVCSLLDARKGEVYYALFKKSETGLEQLGIEEALRPDEIADRIHQPTDFIGTGLERYGSLLKETLGKNFCPPSMTSGPTVAGAAGRIASKDFLKHCLLDLNELSLRYLRKPEAEVNYQGAS